MKNTDTPKANLVRTFPSGNLVDPLNPDVASVVLRDVAHHLSMQCRFAGGVRTFYSVAEHSVLVARLLRHAKASAQTQLAGLLHDAQEYIMHDINTPLKSRLYVHMGDESLEFRDAEEIVQRVIFAALVPGVPELSLRAHGDTVKAADKDAFMLECALLRDRKGPEWSGLGRLPTPAQLGMTALGLPPHVAASRFLTEFEALVVACRRAGVDVTARPPAPVSSPADQPAQPVTSGGVGASQPQAPTADTQVPVDQPPVAPSGLGSSSSTPSKKGKRK